MSIIQTFEYYLSKKEYYSNRSGLCAFSNNTTDNRKITMSNGHMYSSTSDKVIGEYAMTKSHITGMDKKRDYYIFSSTYNIYKTDNYNDIYIPNHASGSIIKNTSFPHINSEHIYPSKSFTQDSDGNRVAVIKIDDNSRYKDRMYWKMIIYNELL